MSSNVCWNDANFEIEQMKVERSRTPTKSGLSGSRSFCRLEKSPMSKEMKNEETQQQNNIRNWGTIQTLATTRLPPEYNSTNSMAKLYQTGHSTPNMKQASRYMNHTKASKSKVSML